MSEPDFLEISREAFTDSFPWQPFAVSHSLQDHPLFELDRLVALSTRLPRDHIEYNLADLPVNVTREQTPLNGLSPQETIASIAANGSWLVLKNVESIPEYRALMDACLDQVYPFARESLAELHYRSAFVFISSPGAVTPFHMDPEHNFLLQIKGGKVMKTWNPDNREVLPEAAIEQHYAPNSHRNLVYRERFDALATTHRLDPGRGVYVPVHAPHWVKVGDEVSISFSITFRSGWSDRNAECHHANYWLKSLGVSPMSPQRTGFSDRCKLAAFKANRKLRRLVSGKR